MHERRKCKQNAACPIAASGGVRVHLVWTPLPLLGTSRSPSSSQFYEPIRNLSTEMVAVCLDEWTNEWVSRCHRLTRLMSKVGAACCDFVGEASALTFLGHKFGEIFRLEILLVGFFFARGSRWTWRVVMWHFGWVEPSAACQHVWNSRNVNLSVGGVASESGKVIKLRVGTFPGRGIFFIFGSMKIQSRLNHPKFRLSEGIYGI